MKNIIKLLFATLITLSINAMEMPKHPASSHANEKSVTFTLMRHGTTERHNGEEIIKGMSQDDALIIDGKFLTECAVLSGLYQAGYCANSLRTKITMEAIMQEPLSEETLLATAKFDEQNLGLLEGMIKKEAMKNPEFIAMLKDPNYKMPGKNSSETAESGNEVITRFWKGIKEIALSNVGNNVFICTSQCAINWMYRYLSGNYEAVLHVLNLFSIVFRYNPENGNIQLLTPDGAVDAATVAKILNSNASTLQEKTT